MKEYESHPAAKLFPMLENGEMQELAEDIKKNGLLHSIILCDGMILDGRNRRVACGIAGVDPHFEKFSGACSPTEYVLATNLKRRQLTASQRATVAANALPLLEAEAKERMLKGKKDPEEKIPQGKREPQARDKAAAIAGVNPRYVSDAKRIKEQDPQLFEQVASGEKTISEARREITRPIPDIKLTDEQAEKVKQAGQESEILWTLNNAWGRANKKERSEFLRNAWGRANKKERSEFLSWIKTKNQK